MMHTILITNNPAVAADAEAAGVTRIMVDLESIGKAERQKGRHTFISAHRKEDIAPIRAALKRSELMVRINPWHAHSPEEVEYAVKSGADILMLPMITELQQLEMFLEHLNGRAQPLPLVETRYSMEHIEDIAARSEIDEIYIGLNDLSLSMRLKYVFEPLSTGLIDRMVERIKARGKAFGFGGIAAMEGGGELPAEHILAEHARLGSSCVILSSRFGKDVHIEDPKGRRERLKAALADMQRTYEALRQRTPARQQADKEETFALITTLAKDHAHG